MGGCGSCGKPKPGPSGKPRTSPTTMASQSMSFKLRMDSGEKHEVRGSLLEAKARLKRLGGNGTIET